MDEEGPWPWDRTNRSWAPPRRGRPRSMVDIDPTVPPTSTRTVRRALMHDPGQEFTEPSRDRVAPMPGTARVAAARRGPRLSDDVRRRAPARRPAGRARRSPCLSAAADRRREARTKGGALSKRLTGARSADERRLAWLRFRPGATRDVDMRGGAAARRRVAAPARRGVAAPGEPPGEPPVEPGARGMPTPAAGRRPEGPLDGLGEGGRSAPPRSGRRTRRSG